MINSAKQLLSIGKAGHVLENTYSCGNLRYALMRLSSPGPPHNRRNRMIRSHLESAQARSQSVLLPHRHIRRTAVYHTGCENHRSCSITGALRDSSHIHRRFHPDLLRIRTRRPRALHLPDLLFFSSSRIGSMPYALRHP